MKDWIITKLGGFPTLASAIKHIKKIEDQESKGEILTEAVKYLFNTIGSEDILKYEDGQYIFQGRPLLPDEVSDLKNQAKVLLSSKLWKVLDMDVKYQLNRKMFLDSSVNLDIHWGKLLQYYHDILNTRIKNLLK